MLTPARRPALRQMAIFLKAQNPQKPPLWDEDRERDFRWRRVYADQPAVSNFRTEYKHRRSFILSLLMHDMKNHPSPFAVRGRARENLSIWGDRESKCHLNLPAGKIGQNTRVLGMRSK